MAELTSRERVRRALRHEETDRIPIDIGGIYNLTTMHRDAYKNLQAHLGFDDPVVINYVPSQSVTPSERIRKRFKADCYPFSISEPFGAELSPVLDQQSGELSYVNEWQLKWRCPAGGFYFDLAEHPLLGCGLREAENFNWPDPLDRTRLDGLRLKERVKEVYEDTDYAIVIGGPLAGGIYVTAWWMIGLENFFKALIKDKPLVRFLMDRVVDYHIGQWGLLLDEVGEYVDVCVLTDDLGAQNAPLMNPKAYRELIKPAHKKVVDFIKSKTEAKVLYHCDGAIDLFLPDIVEIGFDAWNPIQVSAKGMNETARLKELYGDKLCFWGAACDSQHTLSTGSPKDIRAEVKGRISDLAPGGGLVLASIHNIQRDAPVENIVAFYDSLYEYGRSFYQGGF
ncbi:MAG: uroporphyrinogen-III decarboxylase [Deltaproteobacteria bacterium]|jgi:uroporphyrinogen decarboxylase|nr:uroporphyrinogen-III decarboxylase [Deltaproteobacteria bacterium]